MAFFEKAVASDEFKRCIGILMDWGAEFALVSRVEKEWEDCVDEI